jgi:small subunit ribosomal protein S6
MVAKENWGLKKLAYAIQHKKSGFYHLFEFAAPGEVITPYEQEFRRDERIMRFLTVKLDKHAVSWAERRRVKLQTKA